MTRMANRWRPSLVAGLAALVAACPGPQGNRKHTAPGSTTVGGAASAPAEVQIRIETPTRPYRPWQTGMASLVIDNQGPHPVVLHEAALTTSAGTSIISASTVQRFPSAIVVDPLTGVFAEVLSIEGAYLEDNPGAAARMPAPPRWEFRGEGELATFSVLPPGASRRWAGTFRARYDAGDELRARVRFTAISDPGFAYYQKDSEKAEDVAAESQPISGGGMTDMLHVRATYKKVSGIPEGAGEATPPSAPTVIPFAPFAFALPGQAFDALADEEATATAALEIERLAFDLDAARAAAGVAAGAYTRALAAELWVLAGDGVTYLVNANSVAKVRGNAIPLADALNENRKHAITLYRGASKPDEHGYLVYFQQNGFRAGENQEKDGSYTGRLTLDARQLSAFLQALEARGLAMKDDDEVE